MQEKLSKFKSPEWFILIAPIIWWFSYYPNFHFGRSSSANIEFSLPIFYIIILALFGLPIVLKKHVRLLKNNIIFLSLILNVISFISIIWSENKLRTFLTASFMAVLLLCAVVIFEHHWKNVDKLKKIIISSGVIMSLLAILQVIYGTWFNFGLCAGCLARGFGFVRPSVFAIEPQFFGNMLIAPILLQFNEVINTKQNIKSKKDYLSLGIMMMALYLTLSRGAIFALVAALFIFCFLVKNRLRSLIIALIATVISFSVGLIWHGIFTELNPRVTDNFSDSIAKSINQMSLGKISINKLFKKSQDSALKPENKPADAVEKKSDKEEVINQEKPNKALFDGYVEKSTNERTVMNNLAIETWHRDPFSLIFGVGLGSAGRSIFNYTHKTGWDFEIVQNQFLSILLELGLIGFSLFLFLIFEIFRTTKENKIIWAILIGYILQWNFFGGLPNAIHIYLSLILLISIYSKSSEKV